MNHLPGRLKYSAACPYPENRLGNQIWEAILATTGASRNLGCETHENPPLLASLGYGLQVKYITPPVRHNLSEKMLSTYRSLPSMLIFTPRS